MHEIFDIEHKEVFHVTCQPCVANKIKKSMMLDFRLKKKKLLTLFHQFKFSFIFSIDMKETCNIVSLIKKKQNNASGFLFVGHRSHKNGTIL